MSTAKEIRDLNTDQQRKKNSTHVSNLNSEINNPCLKEHKLSHKCLNDNNYDQDACQLHFVNYKNCRDFWYEVSAERRRRRMRPYLPPPEDREQIKNEYLKTNSMR